MKRCLIIGAALSLVLLGGCAAGGQEPGPAISASTQSEYIQPNQTQTEPKQTELIGYEYQYANMQLQLPQGWEWSVEEYTPDGFRFGISFWPEEADGGKVDLFYYPGGFGVCGTGLSQEEIRFDSGLSAVAGTYDNGAVWDFLSFNGTPGHYVAHTDDVGSWWYEYGEEAMEILGSAVLGKGCLTQEKALELARQSCGIEYLYEYAEFDFESGQWHVRFRGKDGQNLWEVHLDDHGDEVARLCGLPKAPEEERA